MATCMESLSASLYTATERTPIFLAVRITRHAISPRLAINTFSILPTPGHDTTYNQELKLKTGRMDWKNVLHVNLRALLKYKHIRSEKTQHTDLF